MKGDVISLVLLVTVQSISFTCTLYILFEFGKKRSQIRCLPNHLIAGLMLISAWSTTVDLPATEFYFWTNAVPIQTPGACRLYNFSLFSISGLNRMFMAFLSIERHFLVFRAQIYRTTRTRWIFHFVPLIIIILWVLIYSLVTDIIITCPQLHFRYSYFLCNYTCSILIPELLLFYIYFQVFFPTVITIVAGILLPIRFVMQKRSMHRFQWRQTRKLTIQTGLICALYTVGWAPYAIFLQLLSNDRVSLSDGTVSRFLIFGPYVTPLLTPFICFYTTTTPIKLFLSQQINRYCFRRHQNIVHPHDVTHNQPPANQ